MALAHRYRHPALLRDRRVNRCDSSLAQALGLCDSEQMSKKWLHCQEMHRRPVLLRLWLGLWKTVSRSQVLGVSSPSNLVREQ
jgi:hypothetical protein